MTTILTNNQKFHIINQFDKAKNSNEFEDNYILEKQEVFYEPGFKVVESVYFDVRNNSTIKKQERHCLDYLRSQACKKEVDKRKKWKKYGEGIKDNFIEGGNIVDPIFMEWNPEIFKSKKTKSFMRQYLNDYQNDNHNEEIHYQKDKCFGDNMPHILQKYQDLSDYKQEKQKFENELSKIIEEKNNIVNTGDITNESKQNSNEPKLFKVNKKGKASKEDTGYMAPHLRNKVTNSDDDIQDEQPKYESVKVSNKDHIRHKSRIANKKEDKACIRVLNLPSDVNFQMILGTLKPILGRIFFKIKTLNDRKTGQTRNFCFLNFRDEDGGQRAFDILTGNKIRIGYSVLHFEWGIKRD